MTLRLNDSNIQFNVENFKRTPFLLIETIEICWMVGIRFVVNQLNIPNFKWRYG